MIVDIFSEVYTILKKEIPNIFPYYPSSTPKFPCVTITESSNITNTNTIDSSGEKHNDITFEVNIFSDSLDTKHGEVRVIREKVDSIMSGKYKMIRGFSGQTPNMSDMNIYRYTLKYSFTINENKVIYRR